MERPSDVPQLHGGNHVKRPALPAFLFLGDSLLLRRFLRRVRGRRRSSSARRHRRARRRGRAGRRAGGSRLGRLGVRRGRRRWRRCWRGGDYDGGRSRSGGGCRRNGLLAGGQRNSGRRREDKQFVHASSFFWRFGVGGRSVSRRGNGISSVLRRGAVAEHPILPSPAYPSGLYVLPRLCPSSRQIPSTVALNPGSPVAQICSKRVTSGLASCGCSIANEARG